MSLSPRSIFPRLPTTRHQEHEQRSPVSESGSGGSSTLTVSSTWDSSPNREKVNVRDSEYSDIELDELPVPLSRSHSTATLVRPPSSCSKLPEYSPSRTNTDEKESYPKPDYKSVSLRWPFIVFILAFIAGLFAFLEYQIHDLPPPHYSMIKIEDPEPGAKRIPDPRPPEDEYPKPPGGIQTKCGWEPPSWTVEHIDDPRCDGFTCEDSPEFCEGGNKTEVACLRALMIEYIITFTTDDPSWCPCHLFAPFDNWGDGGSLMEPDYVYDSTDKGCRSVMLAIQSFNHYKTTELGDKTVVPRDGVLYSALRTRTETHTTPPLPITGYWPYPSTRQNGDIMLPLVSRTAGKEVADAFGNKLQPTDSALFPAMFYSRLYPGHEWIPSGCWAELVWHSDHFLSRPLMESCTETTWTSYETVWWPLPLTRPGASTPIMFPVPVTTTTTTSSSETPTGEVTTTTSTAEVRTSTAPQPVCTSCEDNKSKEPATSSTSSSALVKATDSSTPTNDSSEPVNTSRQPDETEVLLVTGSSSSTTTERNVVSSSTSTMTEQNVSLTTDITPVLNVITSGSTVITITTHALLSSSSPVPTTPPHSAPLIFPIQVSMPADTNGNMNSTSQLPTQPGRPSPRPRPQGPILPSAQSTFYNLRSETSYLMVSVIPVLLATLLSIPIQVFTSSLCRTFPFRALTAFSPENSGTGAPAKDSLLLSLSGGGNGNPFEPVFISLRFLSRYKDPLPFISVILSFLAGVILVPVSSEVIRLEFTTQCSPSFTNGYADSNGGPTFSDNLLGAGPGGAGPNSSMCAFGLRKEGELMRVAEGILVALAGLVLLSGVILSRWKSGVGSEAWSIAGMAALLGSERSGALGGMLRSLPNELDGSWKDEVRGLEAQMESLLEDVQFRLGYHLADSKRPDLREWEYGLYMITPAEKEDDKSIRLTTRDPPTRTSSTSSDMGRSGRILPRIMAVLSCKNMELELALRILALAFTTGLLILILYYECTVGPKTAFEAFMNSQGFGVRILFTAFGTVITAYWSYYFAYISEPQIYHQLAAFSSPSNGGSSSNGTSTEKGQATSRSPFQQGLPANTSILVTPPFNIFVGLYRSFPRSTLLSRLFRLGTSTDDNSSNSHYTAGGCQTLTFHISLATLLARFTPILLSNIPFSNAVTWKIHEACTWMSVAFLLYMVLVLVASLVLPYKALFISAIRERLGLAMTSDNGNKVPFMPIKVDTIVGNMYYLCHSRMVRDFEGLLEVSTLERDRLVCGMGRRYFFGEMASSDSDNGYGGHGPSGDDDGKEQKPGLWYQNMKERAGAGEDDNKDDRVKRVIGVGYC
ncbi:hypothetical protein V8F33_006614 [Rhypophila sp. PSN 637]